MREIISEQRRRVQMDTRHTILADESKSDLLHATIPAADSDHELDLRGDPAGLVSIVACFFVLESIYYV